MSIRRAFRRTQGSLALLAFLVLAVATLAACGGGAGGKTVVAVNAQDDDETAEKIGPLDEASVVAFQLGPKGPLTADDMHAMRSGGEGYFEKWEINGETSPYRVKIKFEIANLGFGDFKGRVSGRIDHRDEDGTVLDQYKFDDKYGDGSYTTSKDGPFEVVMGDWSLRGTPNGEFVVEGKAADGVTFEFTSRGNAWRPGTGFILFGDKGDLYYKVAHPIQQAQTTGTVTVDGTAHASEGVSYMSHRAANIGAHEMSDRFYYFRKQHEGVFIEFWMTTTSKRFDNQQAGYLVVAFDDTVVFESTEIQTEPADGWYTDPDNYGYTIGNGMVVFGRSGDDMARLEMTSDLIKSKDPLASLPALERNVASKFAQPIEYKVAGPWRLDVLADGATSTIEGDGSYSVNVLR